MLQRVRVAALVAPLLFAGTQALSAQIVRYGVMGDTVTTQLRSAWSDDSTQSERAYCVQRARITASCAK